MVRHPPGRVRVTYSTSFPSSPFQHKDIIAVFILNGGVELPVVLALSFRHGRAKSRDNDKRRQNPRSQCSLDPRLPVMIARVSCLDPIRRPSADLTPPRRSPLVSFRPAAPRGRAIVPNQCHRMSVYLLGVESHVKGGLGALSAPHPCLSLRTWRALPAFAETIRFIAYNTGGQAASPRTAARRAPRGDRGRLRRRLEPTRHGRPGDWARRRV